mmetsp:Transcript_56908/g.115856  ORF Transcript_56908/g.115856 Transcript_56908/m.115856 type:complete len:187 (+) Transcript_56908:967-1527(+)
MDNETVVYATLLVEGESWQRYAADFRTLTLMRPGPEKSFIPRIEDVTTTTTIIIKLLLLSPRCMAPCLNLLLPRFRFSSSNHNSSSNNITQPIQTLQIMVRLLLRSIHLIWELSNLINAYRIMILTPTPATFNSSSINNIPLILAKALTQAACKTNALLRWIKLPPRMNKCAEMICIRQLRNKKSV